MKKVLMILSAACFMFVAACGPSAEEQAKEAQRIQDSTAAAIQHVNDSIAEVAQAAEAMRIQDSTDVANAAKAQDSIAAAKKKATKKTAKSQTAPAVPTVGKKKPGAK
ncbi:MAG TPA: hypothetical protein VI757_08815 [Bacteroidia bacterium]|nr:hypothetical protein [Bacteroidia bacterium]